ncbi:UDP-N-acetylmuramoylalanyl-D-glutamate--2,6-diaminopimelate ligase /UDP-N-acetylmuramoyl-tripeptide--D-alanyl-D-alanine ligase [Stappia indica]|uniref:Multifunctional fusion protein n=2 Tax=Stappia indica TaxID=538381 RepID=A0A285RA68_9HYPH|nr:UDP-N-acetylmuramoylalanyl-D-glutamate--2,6-diaminopimelate ligase /UDP-N-acetylmuramoyl-tripeptide--D-alanyl-D-alanine ligase [Stappia indica]
MLLKDLTGEQVLAAPEFETEIAGLSADSRTVSRGFVFAALKGAKADGTRFIAAARDAGAGALLVGSDTPLAALGPDAGGCPVIVSDDPRRELALMASRFYERQPETLVAVTGTSGKTSVAVFTRQIFAHAGFEAASLGTIGTVTSRGAQYGSLTTPDPVSLHQTLARLADDGITHAALEASSHGLDQRRLDGLRLTAAAFTNLGRDHLDYHADVEDYLAAKMRLFDTLLEGDQPVVLEPSAPYAGRVLAVARELGRSVFTVGEGGDDLKLLDIRHDGFAQVLSIETIEGFFEVRLPLAGRFQVSNALVAAGLAICSGVPTSTALSALEDLQGAPGRLELVGETDDGALVFVDYAHKPDALDTALAALRPFTKGRLIAVFGAGGDRDPGKRPLMGQAAARQADIVIVTDDNPRSEDPAKIRAEVMDGAPEALEIGDRRDAIEAAIGMLQPGDVLCIAGKGHEPGQIVGDQVLPFSDHEVAREAIEAMAESALFDAAEDGGIDLGGDAGFDLDGALEQAFAENFERAEGDELSDHMPDEADDTEADGAEGGLHLELSEDDLLNDLFEEEDRSADDAPEHELSDEADALHVELAADETADEDVSGEDLLGEDLADEDLLGEELADEASVEEDVADDELPADDLMDDEPKAAAADEDDLLAEAEPESRGFPGISLSEEDLLGLSDPADEPDIAEDETAEDETAEDAIGERELEESLAEELVDDDEFDDEREPVETAPEVDDDIFGGADALTDEVEALETQSDEDAPADEPSAETEWLSVADEEDEADADAEPADAQDEDREPVSELQETAEPATAPAPATAAVHPAFVAPAVPSFTAPAAQVVKPAPVSGEPVEAEPDRPLWYLDEMVEATGGDLRGADIPDITGVSIDSRSIAAGEAFVAIAGDRFDGHDFAAKACEAGAALAIVARERADKLPSQGRYLVVEDPLEALRDLGRASRARSRARIVAVTGSVGKTSTKDMLKLALSPSGRTHAPVASFNNHWGVPLTLARMPADTEFGVFEIGMNHAGEITPLVQMVRPHVVAITTVEAVHLEFFGSVERIAQAKGEIFLGLEPGGLALLNRDNNQFDLLTYLAKAAGVRRIATFGQQGPADVQAERVSLQTGCSSISGHVFDQQITYKVGAPGVHLVNNSLVVLGAVAELGGDLARAGMALAAFRAPKGRGEQAVLKLPNGRATLIDESYNANPASMRAALNLLKETPIERNGRRIAVIGDMLELGEAELQLHAALNRPVAESGADLVYCAGPRMHALWELLPKHQRGAYSEEAAGLKPLLLEDIRPGDVIMIKGSLGTRMGPLVEALKRDFPVEDDGAE